MNVIYLSKEKVRNVHIPEMIRKGREVGGEGTISMRYGKRIIITTNYDLKNLKEDDFVEIVDFNLLSDFALVIGSKEPSIALPLHWMIYKLPDVNVVIHLHEEKLVEGINDLDKIMGTVRELKNSCYVDDEIFGKICVGFNFDRMKRIL